LRKYLPGKLSIWSTKISGETDMISATGGTA
jgi:hypothetical protein